MEVEETFSREEVLVMVDAVFHRFASDFRREAMEAVDVMMDNTAKTKEELDNA